MFILFFPGLASQHDRTGRNGTRKSCESCSQRRKQIRPRFDIHKSHVVGTYIGPDNRLLLMGRGWIRGTTRYSGSFHRRPNTV